MTDQIFITLPTDSTTTVVYVVTEIIEGQVMHLVYEGTYSPYYEAVVTEAVYEGEVV